MSGWDDAAPRRQPAAGKDDVSRAGETVQRLTSNVANFKKLVGDMGTAKDTTNLRSRLRQTREATTKLAKEAQQLVSKQSADQAEMRRLTKIREMFQAAIKELQTVEKVYMTNEKQMALPQEAPGSMTVDNPLRGGGHRASDITAEGDVQLQMVADKAVSDTRSTISNENAAELRAAAADLAMLQTMVKDVSVMLDEQRIHVDAIEANTSQSADNTAAGTDELAKAREYQAAYRKKCCILWTIIIILVAVIVIAIAVPLAKKNQ
eukprot:TRINITY_DN15350_c0_g1_i1.p1 TRINITY_DN15350_c0_g1~~TRINITY_DN15350_c0_g1_i1.p1  ORF type:complete len:276 (+),score=61.04 TRINITY_DN15350_c0_g1_i1:38-829(+)